MDQLTQTSVAMDEMSTTVADITHNAQLAADAATDAEASASRGLNAISDTQDSMKR
jgi:methyl-accepting chemotaxis protein